MHDKGNEENLSIAWITDSTADTLHFNLQYTRSWFQNPNSYDQDYRSGGRFQPNNRPAIRPGRPALANQDLNIAPTWTHLIGPAAVFTFGGFLPVRSIQLLSQR